LEGRLIYPLVASPKWISLPIFHVLLLEIFFTTFEHGNLHIFLIIQGAQSEEIFRITSWTIKLSRKNSLSLLSKNLRFSNCKKNQILWKSFYTLSCGNLQ